MFAPNGPTLTGDASASYTVQRVGRPRLKEDPINVRLSKDTHTLLARLMEHEKTDRTFEIEQSVYERAKAKGLADDIEPPTPANNVKAAGALAEKKAQYRVGQE